MSGLSTVLRISLIDIFWRSIFGSIPSVTYSEDCSSTDASAVVGQREDFRHKSTAGAAVPHSCL